MSAVAGNEVAGAAYPQYPYLSFIDQVGNQWYSSYNGLQITVTGRGYHGLTFIAGYTLDSAMGFTSSSSTSAQQEDAYNASLDYGPTQADVNNRFTLSVTYAIPGVRTPLQILQGWQISGIGVLQSGMRWFPQDSTSDIQGTGGYSNGIGQTWNYSGPVSAFQAGPHNIPCFGNLPGCTAYSLDANGHPILPSACMSAAVAPYAGNAQLQGLALAALTNLGCYVQGAGVLTPPAYGTFGNATIGRFRGTPYENLDFSVFKDFKFKERVTAEFRAEFYNAFNHPAFNFPNVANPESGLGFGCECTTADGSDSVLGSGGPRSIQLGLKFSF